MTRAQIDDFNLDTTNDVLESTPGVTVERLETDRTDYDVATSSAPDWSYWDVETHRSFLEVQQALGERWSLKGTLTHLDMLSDTQLFYI